MSFSVSQFTAVLLREKSAVFHTLPTHSKRSVGLGGGHVVHIEYSAGYTDAIGDQLKKSSGSIRKVHYICVELSINLIHGFPIALTSIKGRGTNPAQFHTLIGMCISH